MSGFLPIGFVMAAEIRAIWGVERLGRMLATGAVVAYVRDDHGELSPVLPSGWLGDDARRFVEEGALVHTDGERFPLILESRVAGYSLDDLVNAAAHDKARLASPPPANDAGSPVAIASVEARARKAFAELIKSATGKITRRDAYEILRLAHPDLTQRGFTHRIWALDAPAEWRQPGRRSPR